MGRLIKNHWARLLVLTASFYQIVAAIEGFFWKKVFWDFLSHSLDGAVKPVNTLAIINLITGIFMFALEWPLVLLSSTPLHRSFEFRLVLLPLVALSSVLQYQATNAALYYLIAIAAYFWAYSEGELISPEPWTLPKRTSKGSRV